VGKSPKQCCIPGYLIGLLHALNLDLVFFNSQSQTASQRSTR